MDGGWPVPAFNVENVLKLMGSKPFAKTGGLGKCSVCGANYIYGDVWVHEPTGEHIHIGYDCAAKYQMMADRSEYELAAGRHRQAAAREIAKAQAKEERARFLAQHEGLEEALKKPHRIIQDIAQRFQEYKTLSEKQVALVMKLAKESETQQEEKKAVAPVGGRKTFQGTIVSTKSQDGFHGNIEYKMTVKVETADGVWFAWGTIPSALFDQVEAGEQGKIYTLRGMKVEISATLEAGRDPHFAFMKRPIGSLIK